MPAPLNPSARYAKAYPRHADAQTLTRDADVLRCDACKQNQHLEVSCQAVSFPKHSTIAPL
jgi:hypothetical protein